MDIFFCDISGTITGNEKQREKALTEFSNNLTKLIDENKTTKLLFSFVSTNEHSSINNTISEVKKYITDPRIEFWYNYGFDERFKHNGEIEHCKNGKQLQIMNELKSIKEPINTIYFADDTILYHRMIEYFFYSKESLAEKLVHFIPGTGEEEINEEFMNATYSNLVGIDGLNLCIENKLHQKKEEIINKKR